MHPLALELGRVTLHWYGVMVALGFIAGLWTASRRGVRQGIPAETILDLGPWLILGAVIGARALYVVSYWRQQFAGQPLVEIIQVWHGGLVYYGGLAGASAGYLIFARWKRLPVWKVADIISPSIALGQSFGRIGCLLNGCCYGRACAMPWAIRFPADNPSHPPTFPVHPTQIYEALLCLGLYAGLAWKVRHKTFDGQVFGLYLVGYACVRAFVELFRGDYPPEQLLWGWITPAHLVSGATLMVGGLLLWVFRRRAAR